MSIGLALSLHLGRGGAVGFNPRSITGLLAWYDASSLALNDNDAIPTWTDRSGNGRDLTQGTAGARPTFKTAIQNGKAVARFDGGDSLPSASLDLSAYSAMTMFAACAASSLAANRTIVSFGAIATTAGSMELRLLATTGVLNVIGYVTGQSVWGAPAAGTTWHVCAGRIDFSAGFSAEQLAWVDGSSTGATGNDFNNSGTFSSAANLVVGARQGPSQQFVGDIGEVLVYAGSLATADRQAVEAYLRAKWGTP